MNETEWHTPRPISTPLIRSTYLSEELSYRPTVSDLFDLSIYLWMPCPIQARRRVNNCNNIIHMHTHTHIYKYMQPFSDHALPKYDLNDDFDTEFKMWPKSIGIFSPDRRRFWSTAWHRNISDLQVPGQQGARGKGLGQQLDFGWGFLSTLTSLTLPPWRT